MRLLSRQMAIYFTPVGKIADSSFFHMAHKKGTGSVKRDETLPRKPFDFKAYRNQSGPRKLLSSSREDATRTGKDPVDGQENAILSVVGQPGSGKTFWNGTGYPGVQRLIDAINKGFSVKSFDHLKEFTGVSRNALAETVQISERTLARRTVFKADESERIYRVGAVFQRAVEVLGGLSEARRWFTSAQKGLGGATPLDYCRTGLGAREVEDLLGRLEHGVFP